jgi:GNAT superfamily N-acetyltransferase
LRLLVLHDDAERQFDCVAGAEAPTLAKVLLGEEPMSNLRAHGEISIAFSVDRVLDVSLLDGGLGGFVLTERLVDQPWVKDYDAVRGEGPNRWAGRFDVTNWGLIAAHDGSFRVGGAVIAWNTAGVHMLDGRSDLAVLWDLRVRAERRSKGAGTLLFHAAEVWARDRGCAWLKVETQNINVPACRFYRRMGCVLGAIDRFAYPDLPGEVQLLWFKELT